MIFRVVMTGWPVPPILVMLFGFVVGIVGLGLFLPSDAHDKLLLLLVLTLFKPLFPGILVRWNILALSSLVDKSPVDCVKFMEQRIEQIC